LAYQPPASSTFISEQISHQPAVLLSQNKSATSNQPAVLFSQNKSALAIGQTNKRFIFRAPRFYRIQGNEDFEMCLCGGKLYFILRLLAL
jgi:hypothetical protein